MTDDYQGKGSDSFHLTRKVANTAGKWLGLGEAAPATDATEISGGNAIEQIATLAALIDQGMRALDDTELNRQASALLSIPQALARHTTISDLGVLDSDYAIAAPDAEYQAEHSPTVNDFMNAAYSGYAITGQPLGLSPFLVNGRQLEVVDQASGLSARVWADDNSNKLIIAYAGTTAGDVGLFLDPTQIIGQALADIPTFAGRTSLAQEQGLQFAQYVAHEAALQGYPTGDIYVTGHSLGGNIAQYVAQQTGLGGIAWSASGIPVADDAPGDGANFVSLGRYGDVVTAFASDIEGAQPAAPAYDPEGGALPHWGTVILVGDPDSQSALHERLIDQGGGISALLQDFLLGPSGVAHNLVGIEKDIGGELGQFTLYPGSFDGAQGPVFNIAGDSLADAIAANQNRSEVHYGYLPGDSGVLEVNPQPPALAAIL